MLTTNNNKRNQEATMHVARTALATATALLVSILPCTLDAASSFSIPRSLPTAKTASAVASTAKQSSASLKSAAKTATQSVKGSKKIAQPAKTAIQTAKTSSKHTNQATSIRQAPSVTRKGAAAIAAGQNFASRNIASHARIDAPLARISNAAFQSRLGVAHSFRMEHPMLVGGHLHFFFAGFGFGILDPWPLGWLATDQFYVDNVGGNYYLCDGLHPEVRLAMEMTDSDVADTTPETDSSNPEPVASSDAANADSAPAPVSITRGQTPAQVVAVLGNPTTIVRTGARSVYVYNGMRLTFIAGRLRDVR